MSVTNSIIAAPSDDDDPATARELLRPSQSSPDPAGPLLTILIGHRTLHPVQPLDPDRVVHLGDGIEADSSHRGEIGCSAACLVGSPEEEITRPDRLGRDRGRRGSAKILHR